MLKKWNIIMFFFSIVWRRLKLYNIESEKMSYITELHNNLTKLHHTTGHNELHNGFFETSVWMNEC